jgi:hypothetical protein
MHGSNPVIQCNAHEGNTEEEKNGYVVFKRNTSCKLVKHKAGSLKINTALEYSTRVVQEGGRRCKKSTLNDLVHMTPLRIPLMNPPI